MSANPHVPMPPYRFPPGRGAIDVPRPAYRCQWTAQTVLKRRPRACRYAKTPVRRPVAARATTGLRGQRPVLARVGQEPDLGEHRGHVRPVEAGEVGRATRPLFGHPSDPTSLGWISRAAWRLRA